MKEFKEILQSLNQQLELPQPTKSRILLEIYSDLTSAYRQFMDEGMEEGLAVNRAKETFGLSGDNIGLLTELHRPSLGRIIDQLTASSKLPLEKPILTILFSLIAFFIVQIILGGTFMQNASFFIYPLLSVFLIAFVLSGFKLYQLFIKQDHNPRRLRKGISLINTLIVLILFMGITGYSFETYWAAQKSLYLGPFFFLTFFENVATLLTMANWMMKTASLMIICLTTLLFSGLLWFILVNKIQKIEYEEASILLAE